MMPTPITLTCAKAGTNGTVRLTAGLPDGGSFSDKLDVTRAGARERFISAIMERAPAADRVSLAAELESIAVQTTAPPPPAGALAELDVSAVARPELFHHAEVSGVTIAVVHATPAGPAAEWTTYLQWADGRRERRPLPEGLALADGSSLWLVPQPGPPAIGRPAWSAAARDAWLRGEPAPQPGDVFQQLCTSIERFIDFPPQQTEGAVATLALWSLLSYAYPCWSAIPFVSVGGPLGSGKSRVFEVLARVVFRPLVSANTTAPTLFRTLNDLGGTLLLDESERLRDNAPDAGELRSILLAGYKKGSPARRTEKCGDGFRQVSFDVFGLKAVAGIAQLPEALASRCIRFVMFRSAPGSPKPARQIDEDPHLWARVRDELHALALEHGRTWLRLAARPAAHAGMSGRDAEVWGPLLALAGWLQAEHGAAGLLAVVEDFARELIDLGKEESVPETDEILLRILAEAVLQGWNAALTPARLLERAAAPEGSPFRKTWSPNGVGAVLRRYGVRTSRSNGERTYRNTGVAQLAAIERAYGIDLGLGDLAPGVAPPAPTAPPNPVLWAENAGTGGADSPPAPTAGRAGAPGAAAPAPGCPVDEDPPAELLEQQAAGADAEADWGPGLN